MCLCVLKYLRGYGKGEKSMTQHNKKKTFKRSKKKSIMSLFTILKKCLMQCCGYYHKDLQNTVAIQNAQAQDTDG